MPAELVDPPPAGVAPLDQFRAALLLTDEAEGEPPNPYTLTRTNAELLQFYRYENTGGACEKCIREMDDRGGWPEADAAVGELGLCVIPAGIGLAVRERRCFAAAFCHGVAAPIARVGL